MAWASRVGNARRAGRSPRGVNGEVQMAVYVASWGAERAESPDACNADLMK
jgi:hypothetical protein